MIRNAYNLATIKPRERYKPEKCRPRRGKLRLVWKQIGDEIAAFAVCSGLGRQEYLNQFNIAP